jgi:hypothetical protein
VEPKRHPIDKAGPHLGLGARDWSIAAVASVVAPELDHGALGAGITAQSAQRQLRPDDQGSVRGGQWESIAPTHAEPQKAADGRIEASAPDDRA